MRHQNGVTVASVTTDLTSPNDGTLWYRSDRGNFSGQMDGSPAELSTSPYMFKPSSGQWMKVSQAGSVGAGAPTVGDMMLYPFWPGRKMTVAQMAFEITTQGISVSGTDNMRFGWYGSDATTGFPTGSALADYGQSSIENAVGVVVINPNDFAMDPILYWFAAVRQTTGSIGTAGQVRQQSAHPSNYAFVKQTAGTPLIGTDGGNYGYFVQGGVTGVLPAIVSVAPINANAPLVLLQVA